MRLGRIQDDIVVEIVTVPDLVRDLVAPEIPAHTGEDGEEADAVPAIYKERPATPADFFHPDMGFEIVDEIVAEGWVRSGGGFVPPPPPVADAEQMKAMLKGYAASRHAEIERGGYRWNGHVVMTDPESQQKLAAERLAVVTGDRTDGEIWIMAGGPVALTNAQISEISTAVRAWIQTLYAVRAAILERIEDGSIRSTADVDEAFLTGLPAI